MADYIYLADEGQVFFCTHGHKYDIYNVPPMMPDGAILMTGHTHVAEDTELTSPDGRPYRYLNPGSPSIPKEDTLPSYIIIENGKAELRRFT
jgi:predicted phosphodiesterase